MYFQKKDFILPYYMHTVGNTTEITHFVKCFSRAHNKQWKMTTFPLM